MSKCVSKRRRNAPKAGWHGSWSVSRQRTLYMEFEMLNEMKPKTGRLFVISDTHFFHDNIVKYCWRPGYNPRHDEPNQHHDFNVHNEVMVDHWKRWVTASDVVLHLGDMMQTKAHNREKLLEFDLPGKKFLVLGNHDHWSIAEYAELGFEVVDPWSEMFDEFTIHFDHYPSKELGPGAISIHGHTHNNPNDQTMFHRNLSVEQTNYTPLPLFPILQDLVGWLSR